MRVTLTISPGVRLGPLHARLFWFEGEALINVDALDEGVIEFTGVGPLVKHTAPFWERAHWWLWGRFYWAFLDGQATRAAAHDSPASTLVVTSAVGDPPMSDEQQLALAVRASGSVLPNGRLES